MQHKSLLIPAIRLTAVAFLALALGGCKPSGGSGDSSAGGDTKGGAKVTIQNKGSDTMVNVAQAWAEEYKKIDPNVSIEVGGGGSGQGIAALQKGTIDLCNSSRNMKPAEIEQTKKNTGKEPKEFVVGYDALAIYVHKDNPLNEITMEQLDAIFSEGGKFNKWSELGIKNAGCGSDEIIRVSRQSSSGTFEFFREHVLNKKDFKAGARELGGSKEVVELVGTTPCAIGYSGMGYNSPAVKMLKVSAKAGTPGVGPSVEATLNKTYPIARSLLLYSLGEPEGALKKYLDWIVSDAGQKIVEVNGYVPLPKK